MYMYICVCIHTDTYIYIYIYTHIYTYIHTKVTVNWLLRARKRAATHVNNTWFDRVLLCLLLLLVLSILVSVALLLLLLLLLLLIFGKRKRALSAAAGPVGRLAFCTRIKTIAPRFRVPWAGASAFGWGTMPVRYSRFRRHYALCVYLIMLIALYVVSWSCLSHTLQT